MSCLLTSPPMIPCTSSNVRYMAFGKFIRRNFVSISFPVLTATLIWLDWNHTKNWKAQLKQN